MKERIDRAQRQLWHYLETGQRDNALAVIGYLVKAHIDLAASIREIATIADAIRLGQDTRDFAARLQDIAVRQPRLAQTESFRALAKELKIDDHPASLSPIVEPAISQGSGEPEVHQDKQDQIAVAPPVHRNGWFGSLMSPRRKTGVVVTILISIIIVLLCDLAAYVHMQRQPTPSIANMVSSWLYIQNMSKPVDSLYFGDSSLNANLSVTPFADRLGGATGNPANNAGSNFLEDAWMLTAYIERFGPPRNVVLLRNSPPCYNLPAKLETMAALPLKWGYWNHYGLAPAWGAKGIFELFFYKYFPLYSNADVILKRLSDPKEFFADKTFPKVQYLYDFGTGDMKQEPMDINKNLPAGYLSAKFNPSTDTTNALHYMSDLARSKKFQLYILFQPEWDEAVAAGLRTDRLIAQKDYLLQFADPDYVHIVRDESLVFPKDMMQQPLHLWDKGSRIFTEIYIDHIVTIQNNLTASQAQPLTASVAFDKSSYKVNDKPAITVNVNNQGKTKITGSMSYLIRPAGTSDTEWVARAPAIPMTIPGNGKLDLKPDMSVGKIDKAGIYDLVVFVRQDVGNLSHETRIDFPKKLEFK